jgi:hypothetical protein
MKLIGVAAVVLGSCLPVLAQAIPDVTCPVEDFPVKAVVAWQFPQVQKQVQVLVLRDPAGEQEARFDLTHGGSLISLRYRAHEMLFGQTAGASVSMFAPSHNKNPELKDVSAYWAAYSPDQGGSSMGIPAVVTGVSCAGDRSMRAFAMMQDRGSDSSFQKQALLGVNAGHISDNYPAGYATRFSIETNASWIPNPGGAPRFYLKLDQSVVNVAPQSTGPLEWYLNVAAPWNFEHAANYPEKCLEKTPCSGKDIGALASGRYRDAAQTDGIAMVVPSAGWRTPRAYYRPNAEYVVLLYNAVWAAPRRTFASVLEQSMEGTSARRFTWYVCAGAWQQARAFAEAQPATDKTVDPEAPELVPSPPTAQANAIACTVSEFKPEPNQTDQAVVLVDPAGEQTATFDITQGGALVSLIYGGQEHVWKYNGGGLLQMAFHNHMEGAWEGDYNPTQAGDGSASSPVTGVACDHNRSLDTVTTMLDFNHNNGFYPKALVAVWDGRENDMVPLSYDSPYVLETHTEWIPNPKGAPAYYLRLRERLIHVADEKVGPFSFDFASYVPWEFTTRAVSPENCPCTASQTNSIVGGWYKDERRTVGLAVAMPASNFPDKKISGGFNSDFMWRNRNFHLGSHEALDGIAAKDFVWYVMPGSWENAKSFAVSLGK